MTDKIADIAEELKDLPHIDIHSDIYQLLILPEYRAYLENKDG